MFKLTVSGKFTGSYAWSCSICEVKFSFSICFRLTLLHSMVRCLTPFSSMDLLHFNVGFLMIFHLTYTRFSPSTHLLMCLSLETLTSIIRTGLPTLVELIGSVNSVIIFFLKRPYSDG